MRFIFLGTIFFLFFVSLHAQTRPKVRSIKTKPNAVSLQASAKNSPAYGELVLRRTELEVDYKEILVEYTENHPNALAKKSVIDAIDAELKNIEAMPASQIPKLTSPLGKLILRKVELETELKNLQQEYTDDFPDVKKTKTRLEAFQAEIKKMLQ